MADALTLDQLRLRKEKDYFTFVAILAGICWLVIVVTIIGLIYGLLIAFFVWLAHGLMIAHLQAESVLVTEEQMPVLYRTYREVIEKLEVAEVPPLYIMQAHGLLNAFATRRSGRHFVVLYSDMLEACGEDTAQIRFLLGHELGHVRSNHLYKKMLLLPGLLFPLIGSAYSRACESTCDRYGTYAAGDLRSAAQAMLILAGGKMAWHSMDPERFSYQYRDQRGFFISWHELTSGYPTLSQRAFNILNMDISPEPIRAPRHWLAYVFALFSAGGRQGTGGNLLVTIAMIAVLMGILTPALNNAKLAAQRAQAAAAANAAGTVPPAPGYTNPAGVGGVNTLKQVTFCTTIVDGVPADSLSSIPDSLDTFYIDTRWNLQPGPHQESIKVSDANSKVLYSKDFAFIAQGASRNVWMKLSLAAVSPRPAEYNVYIYLDGQEIDVERLGGG
jgi:Zn-dependent protease with chaperone function